MIKLLLAGATGLVGQAVLDQHDQQTVQITTVGRRATGRVAREIITDFKEELSGDSALPASTTAICALGTTIAAAGSRSAFYAVDHEAVMRFALAAQNAGVDHFLVVSAVGANPKSRVFYSRVKGETERELQRLNFPRLDIAQPGLLLGERPEHRPVESLLQTLDPVLRPIMKGPLDRYGGISVNVVAAALLTLARSKDPGVYRHENRSLHSWSDG